MVEHVANMGVKKNAYGCLVGNPEGKSRWKNPAVDGRMIFEGLKTRMKGRGLNASGLG